MENKNSSNSAVFFISSGRCGTQFFADKLGKYYGDIAVVEHEPFHLEYKPLHYFSAYHRNEKIKLSPILERHIAFIGETLNSSHYIETGWPCYGLLPYMISRFEAHVKIVHLYRHPLNIASSLLTHNVYDREVWSENMSISPSTDGVLQNFLEGEAWKQMSEFEKCLFWWTEINQFALHINKHFPSIPFLSLKFENFFSGDSRAESMKLAAFIGLAERSEFANSAKDKTDQFSCKTNKKIDISSLLHYPRAIETMAQLGYSYNESMIRNINTRYSQSSMNPSFPRIRRIYQYLYDIYHDQSR